jgi:hypothetical protein
VPRITGYEMRSGWIADDGAVQEYTLHINADGIGTRHDIIGILTFGADRKLSGERIYASDELIQFMFGPFRDTATRA